MRETPLPDFETDEEYDDFYNNKVVFTKYLWEALEGIDKQLEKHNLEIVVYDAAMSELVFTVEERN